MRTIAIILAGAAALVVLPARAETSAPASADVAPTGTATLANPAAVFCTESGGAYQITKAADGSEAGTCTIDGQTVDAWDYFREHAPKSE